MQKPSAQTPKAFSQHGIAEKRIIQVLMLQYNQLYSAIILDISAKYSERKEFKTETVSFK